MANKNIKEVEGGEVTTLNDTDGIEIDSGSLSVWIQTVNFSWEVIKRLNLPDGTVINGKLSVTVASNNLTVALKTLAGNDPSTSSPVLVKINGTWRSCTAALSKTLAAGTQWFALGANFATLEQNFFVYLIWNTTPATDIVDLGFARFPQGRVYSDFSGTTTNEKYLANANASAPTATDDVVNIGRFAATLSATAAFNWSVPAFTNSNLIQRPIFESEWMTYAPTLTNYSANPTNTVYQYRFRGNTIDVRFTDGTAGTHANNTSNPTYSTPFTAKTLTNKVWFGFLLPVDAGAVKALGWAQLNSGGVVISMNLSAAAAWTANGSASASSFIEYQYI